MWSKVVPFQRHLLAVGLIAGLLLAVPGKPGQAQDVGTPDAGGNSVTAPASPGDTTPPPDSATTPTAAKKPAISGVTTASSTYRLQPYDLIDVQVYSEDDLHKPARLGSDGTVLLPLIGSVKVGGLTVAEATDLITKKFAAGYVKNPSVLITVLEYRKRTFSILGQIMHTGLFEISEGSHVSIVDAITMAGGFTTLAAQNAVTVKRTVDGKTALYKIKVADMAQSPDAAPFEVLPGDTIDVPGMVQGTFTIYGQVQHPGVFNIPGGAHVSMITAISLGGGFAVNAAQNGVIVKRMVDGRPAVLTVRAADMAQGAGAPSFEVMPNDSIIVPQRNSSFSILGDVSRPGIYEIPEGQHVNIIEAVLMAGGFTRTAAQNSVTVKRMADGRPVTLKVRAGKMARDANLVPFEVQPGDIVNVPENWY